MVSSSSCLEMSADKGTVEVRKKVLEPVSFLVNPARVVSRLPIGCVQKVVRRLHMLYAKLEEEHGLARLTVAVFRISTGLPWL